LTLRLTVDAVAWRAHVEHLASAYSSLVPVVKGNGYGFGRARLARIAEEIVAGRRGAVEAPTIAVGTVHELAGLPYRVRPLVLTPPVTPALSVLRSAPRNPVVSVGDAAHVAALSGWNGEVLVKLASSMRRFGVLPRQLDELEGAVRAAGLTAIGYSLHLPLSADDAGRVAEIERWLTVLDARRTTLDELWVSHLGADAYADLCSRWPKWRFPMRIGTALWHGDKSALHLGADVLDVHAVAGGTLAGYHGSRVIADGALVVVGAGSAHGVAVLDDGRSPFHFERRRLALLELPHMHTSMVFVPAGETCPAIGDVVDVQRPLTMVAVDDVVWRES
jgi:alanine racemase